ncbi:hypothetical protein [Yinghuangia sp. YIM S10712]|uniref:hypothetical protein n=1 Tax=Yinghuangia sp. YIM S10712 TaxID=3436930 RepID=UPI003F538BB6
MGDGLVEERVVTEPDGSGTISACLHWPPGGQAELTGLFRECVRELWACLDELVVETVEGFSALHRPHRPQVPRFFPVADSPDAFQDLLADLCMDGTLRTHVAMVEDCQPYQGRADDQVIDLLRRSLAHLVHWDAALDDGAVVSAWATPVEPRVHAEPPEAVASVVPSSSGALGGDDRVLAEYRLVGHHPGGSVSAQAGTNVDICFVDGFTPSDADDTFDRRLASAIEAVVRLAVSFAWLSSRVPGSRRILLPPAADGSSPWTEATRSSRGWTDDELAMLATSDIGLGRARDAETITLLVTTPDGVYERVIPQASPLRTHPKRGVAAELAVEAAAATWGLPDFVMAPSVERKGNSVREISDGLLVVGSRGVVVQSKAREVEPGTAEREASWITKQLTAAAKQIHGTVRRLKAKPVQKVNGRGRSIRVDSPAVDWVGVVIIDHPCPPDGLYVPAPQKATPVVNLCRREWEFLFHQLRSAHAVVAYLHRVGGSVPVLGTEPERYYELAGADATAPPGPLDPAWMRHGAETRSTPLLPTAPAGSDDDEAHAMVRILLEDVATSPMGPDDFEAWQGVLASLDSLPVGYRTELGRLLIDSLAAVTEAEAGTTMWRIRTFLAGPEEDQLGFAVCSALTDETRAGFSAWLQLRHHERGAPTDLVCLTTVGVLLTPRVDGFRDWDTTVIALTGDQELTDDELRVYQGLWNTSERGGDAGVAQ